MPAMQVSARLSPYQKEVFRAILKHPDLEHLITTVQDTAEIMVRGEPSKKVLDKVENTIMDLQSEYGLVTWNDFVIHHSEDGGPTTFGISTFWLSEQGLIETGLRKGRRN